MDSMQGTRAAPEKKEPPFPWKQMIVLALCRITEPIAFCSIFPYVYYMIESFHVTDDESKIATYCGLITSTFAFCEFATGVIWGRLSDTYGRKPILLIGLFGTGLSMLLLGFAKSMPMALLARAIGGCLNGNVGVLQTTVAEVVQSRDQQPFAFSIMPFVWCVGSIAGSTLGGLLATNYDPNREIRTIWDKYPYLLPNVVSSGVVVLGIIVGFLFLEESLEIRKGQRDIGVDLGKWLTRMSLKLIGRGEDKDKDKKDQRGEIAPLLREGHQPIHDTSAIDYNSVMSHRHSSMVVPDPETASGASVPVGKTFNNQVLIQIAAYGVIAFHTISFEQLMPVMLAMPEAEPGHFNLIYFNGGFDLPTTTIGAILGSQGLYQMIFQVLVFAPVIYKLGPLKTWKYCAYTFGIIYFLTPYLVLLPHGPIRFTGLAIILMLKISWSALAYPANMLLLTNAAPSLLVLGTINGAAAACASLCRAIGPTLSGIVQSVGLDANCFALPFWMDVIVCIGGAILSLWMEEDGAVDEPTEGENDEVWERESAIFRRGSAAINVSNVAESSIGESAFLAASAHRGSVMRRMSVSSRRESIPWSNLSRQTSQHSVMKRDRSISFVGRDRSISTTSRQAGSIGPRGSIRN